MMCTKPLDLEPYCNARGTTYDGGRLSPGMNAWRNTMPAEEVPLGKVCAVSGVEFQLSQWRLEGDHVEALGQSVEVPYRTSVRGLALLCCGEMGDQDLEITIAGDREVRVSVTAPGWLLERGKQEEGGVVFSHLHYPGDYDLDLLRPALWTVIREWSPPIVAQRLQFGVNPLFHVFAVSLIEGDSACARSR